MARTPDRKSGDRDETAVVFEDTSPAVTTAVGELRYSGDAFKMRDVVGEFDPRSGLPTATAVGQVLYSLDGSSFTVQQPLTSVDGWLTNDLGELLVVG